jgi:hypothetical protein
MTQASEFDFSSSTYKTCNFVIILACYSAKPKEIEGEKV